MITPLRPLTAIEFARTVPLEDVLTPNQAVKELYGYTEWALDIDAFTKKFHENGYSDGLDDAICELEWRLSYLGLRYERQSQET